MQAKNLSWEHLIGINANMTATDPLLDLIEARMDAIGLTPAAASRMAVGNDYLIYNLRKKGFDPKLTTLRNLCSVLGLEFYIGMPRGTAAKAIPVTDYAKAGDISPEIAAHLKTAREGLTCLEAALKHSHAPLEDAAALASEAVNDGDPPGSRPVSIVEAMAAAGGGALNDDEAAKGKLWFRRDWLDSHAINPAQCVVIGVKGESMEPVLMDGCSVLVDRSRTRRRAGRIYAIRTADGLVAKRLDRDGGDWRLVSEHSSWAPTAWTEDMEIVGEVRWTARSI